MDGVLVIVSLIDVILSLSASQNRHIVILRVFRLLRTLRPLRFETYFKQCIDFNEIIVTRN